MPRTLRDGLTIENLRASIDEVLKGWTRDDESAFINRYTNVQFGHDGPRPRASIPLQADDDDVVLGRLVDIADDYFKLLDAARQYVKAADAWANSYNAIEVSPDSGIPRLRRSDELATRDFRFALLRAELHEGEV